MPRADYRCPVCGVVKRDIVFPAHTGARASAPPCPDCSGVTEDGLEGRILFMAWIPQCRFDLATDGEGGRGGQKFTVSRLVPTRDGPRQVEEVIDSAHARRRIERDSEQRYRDGEGEPLRFRMDHQTASNRDVNSFGAEGKIGDRTYDSGKTPARSGKIGLKRHGQKQPRIPLGPGRVGSPLGG